ncbi:MAG: uncharacterized protein QOD77_876 [Thermoplasmata archaeon]|jgi:predicted enzyme related to lactoylglutathione lyase|nr:uncharacterized protein [Thermoplasmata archaeon]
MDPVIHFELPADDVARARRFYEAAFGWRMASPPGGAYTFITTTPTDPKTMMPQKPGGINGGMMARPPMLKGPAIIVQVDDLEAAVARIEKAGGKKVWGPQDVGPGRSAYFVDTEGSAVGLFQPKAPPG